MVKASQNELISATRGQIAPGNTPVSRELVSAFHDEHKTALPQETERRTATKSYHEGVVQNTAS
jgi:hypothetical protein